jgi:His-Xaa-Ser system protein HxsD
MDGLEPTDHPGPSYACTVDGTHVALRVDTTLFSPDCILKAAYKFTDRCFVFLHREAGAPETVWVTLAGKPQATDSRSLVGDFANELIDQRLREALGREFGPVQTLIVAQAFAEGNLLDPERETGDYHADPHGAGRRR